MTTTPRPWFARQFRVGGDWSIVVEGGTVCVATGKGESTNAANLALIIRAVNTFDEAKAALQAIVLTDTKRVGITVNPHILYCEAVAKAKAVLARMSG